MSGQDLGYDSAALELLASQLATITDDLKNDDDLTRHDKDDVSSDEVASAIDDFVDDWDDKRDQLVKKVEALAEMAGESYEKLTQTDQDLADALQSEER